MADNTARKVSYIPITKARINLGSVVRRVRLNKDLGKRIPVAGIMDADELEDYLELQDPKVRRMIKKSNEDIRAGRTRPAEELLAELRAGFTRKVPTNRRPRR